ncbi:MULTISPECIES: hypothetical protein [unclassified Rathayibacter]|uniref:hypothetical protein n=1 Tax=unclassified Rathayibacter TaxID=2609250 RepID=UPI00188AC1C1|nr:MULTISPECIES: hypothetical protein [unclassified Rathayibacter]MBF4461382.1 hypothetical protein [Rathayibacter sp. VKM Ac-2879]MBF4502793.1 hypothetical protein [Rathayibacter sp. VKM Ac-2878]
MTHHDENHEVHESASDADTRQGRHRADGTEPSGEYTSTDGVSHTASEEERSYVDTSTNEEDSSVKGGYVDTDAAGTESEPDGEYTDRDE